MNKKTGKDGKIITFYSYKGGVGRTMAMANVAVMMARWGYKVLIIDWDLEAPGLENFYKNHFAVEKSLNSFGLIDILGNEKVSWQKCVQEINLGRNNLSIISSGKRDENYYEKVRLFDFKSFYETRDGGNVIEKLRKEWKQEYDFVLIDSRTGVTDTGGVCTVQLPDILVLLFTPTYQGFEGIKKVALQANKNRRLLPFERVGLLTLPIPTRIDNSEFKLSQEWFDIFDSQLEEVYDPWLPENVNRREFLLNTKIPYISYFSFDEKLPVMEEGVTNPTGMGFSYTSVAALLATHLNYPQLLIEDRRQLIALAKTAGESEVAEAEEENISKRTLFAERVMLLRSKVFQPVNLAVLLLVFVAATIISLFFIVRRESLIQSQNELIRSQAAIIELKDSSSSFFNDKYYTLKDSLAYQLDSLDGLINASDREVLKQYADVKKENQALYREKTMLIQQLKASEVELEMFEHKHLLELRTYKNELREKENQEQESLRQLYEQYRQKDSLQNVILKLYKEKGR